MLNVSTSTERFALPICCVALQPTQRLSGAFWDHRDPLTAYLTR
jgi:hypothetical protein